MIFDAIDHLKFYYPINSRFKAVTDFLNQRDYKNLSNGRYDIADGLYAIVMENKLKPETETLWESHRKYIDIQIAFNGAERIGVSEIASMKATNEYNSNDDYQLFSGSAQNYITLKGEFFALFAPQDVHRTSIAVAENEQSTVRKIVFKVALL